MAMTHGSLNYDLCIIGGGINGAGIARDAAGRGVRTILFEQGDLGHATSSSSTKLIHGGLRYLEFYEFGLVRSALKERNIILKIAPHIVKPMSFVLPHNKKLRPKWMIRMGLYLYDHLARRAPGLKRSKQVRLRRHKLGEPLKKQFGSGFIYSDCWVDDSRLVVLNAMDARDKGADIRPHTKVTNVERKGGRWLITVKDMLSGQSYCVTSKMVVNAAGPWVSKLLHSNKLEHKDTPHLRLVKGSHIIVSKLYDGEQAYVLQQADGRIIFVIPYEGRFTLIGTTEEIYEGDPAMAMIDHAEIDYLCAAVNAAFNKTVGPDEILWTYSGVRPLIEDGAKDARAVTRDYRLEMDEDMVAPLLNVFGGKITTYRVLAEKAVNKVVSALNAKGAGKPWTSNAALPGGDFLAHDKDKLVREYAMKYGFLSEPLIARFVTQYGLEITKLMENASCIADMGRHFGHGLYVREVAYLIENEFAISAVDILFRRTKIGLLFTDDEFAALERWMDEHKEAFRAARIEGQTQEEMAA